MRIAVPTADGAVCGALAACTAVTLYEDDHGKVTGRSVLPVGAGETARAVLERCGADVLLGAALAPEERRALAEAGLLLAETAERDADGAVRAYLNAAVVCDPNNTCHYCGFRDECPLPREA